MLRFNNKITYVNAECGRTAKTYSSNLNAILFFAELQIITAIFVSLSLSLSLALIELIV